MEQTNIHLSICIQKGRISSCPRSLEKPSCNGFATPPPPGGSCSSTTCTTLLHLPERLPHHPPEVLGVYCVTVTDGLLLLPYAAADGAQGGPLFDLALAQTMPAPPQWFRDIVLYHDALRQWQRHVATVARPAAPGP